MGKTIHIFTHALCNDGNAATGLLCRALHEEYIVVHPISASLDDLLLSLDMGTAYFVDCCPTKTHMPRLEAAFDKIVIYDHHASSLPDCETIRDLPKWTVVHDVTRCATQIVRDEHKIEGVDLLVEMTAKFDLWADPSDATFAWMFAAGEIWNRNSSGPGATARASTYTAYVDHLAGMTLDAMVEKGKGALDEVHREYATLPLSMLDFDSSPEWDGRALVARLDDASQPSILLHWALRDHPKFKIAIGVWRKKHARIYKCSVRSVDVDVTQLLPWARGHPHAAGGSISVEKFSEAVPLTALRKREREDE